MRQEVILNLSMGVIKTISFIENSVEKGRVLGTFSSICRVGTNIATETKAWEQIVLTRILDPKFYALALDLVSAVRLTR
ncbi:hypothetical protein Desmer_1288 [Desulfosporosinus meridiei DSM 13257]|uniref:Uncharacterized protein n=1 Tax=Desulfosporosinus meridiei (strain ATCC BAA-275 / DSM 13257 / KCTC 12902 / NCIMB 13706 / S10) TaxID=768704 RepID=J7IT20_DESMD|nr:hypothetical protein Desmer_1288 [Desulfosporosinus meridiei DSM 13257]